VTLAMLDTPPLPAVAGGGDLFGKHLCQLVFATHGWAGRRQSKAVEATTNGEKVAADRASSPRVSLLPAELEKLVASARAGVDLALKRHTFSCDQPGTRLVSTRHSAAFVAEFEEAAARYAAAADTLVARYDEILAYNRDFWLSRLGGDETRYEREIRRLIPPRDRLRARFSIEYRLTGGETALARERFNDTAVAGFFAEAADNARRHQEEMVEALVREPVAQLAASLEALEAQLADGKKLTPATFSGVAAAISLCRACADVIDPAVMAKITAVATQIDGVVAGAEHHKAVGGSYTAAIKPHKKTLCGAIAGVIDACRDERAQAEALARYGALPRAMSFAAFDEDE
jgi:hypothetical protein